MTVNCTPSIILSPSFGYVVECTQFQPNALQSNNHVSIVKNMSPSFCFVSSVTDLRSCRAFGTKIDPKEAYHIVECCEQLSTDSKDTSLGSYNDTMESLGCEDHKENQRRRKIGLANKGKVPWNKGKKHSAETRERIRQKTKEAMRDPKVRKKMSECPRAHSNQTKARISSSLIRLWGERLKWKRLREEFFQSWAESIAKAAKKGGSDQQELDWDSYEDMKREIILQQFQWALEKAKAKEMVGIRTERAAQAKAEKIARLAQRRTEREEKAMVRGEKNIKTRKMSNEEKEELAVAQELKLKERLTKIHRKKSTNGHVTSKDHREWERFDVEFIKRERMRKEVSLADQIRAVKDKRAEFIAKEALATSSSAYRMREIT